MPTLTPLGYLAVLPREIRDNLYCQLVALRYYANVSNSIIRPAVFDGVQDHSSLWPEEVHNGSTECGRLQDQCPSWPEEFNEGSDGLVILRVSKTIYGEAFPILYARSRFVFFTQLLYGYQDPFPESLNTKLRDRLMNIEITYYIGRGDAVHDASDRERISDFLYCRRDSGPLEVFQKGDVVKNSMIVELQLDSWASYAYKLEFSPLVSAIKDFTMFNSVVIRVRIARGTYCPLTGTSRELVEKLEAAEDWEELYPGLTESLAIIGSSLEATLGPCSAVSQLLWQSHEVYRHIEFRPQNYVARISEMGKGSSGTEEATTGDEESMNTRICGSWDQASPL